MSMRQMGFMALLGVAVLPGCSGGDPEVWKEVETLGNRRWQG